MTLHTITLARPLVLPQNSDCDCCASHLVDVLRGRAGVAAAELDGAQLRLEIDAGLVPDAEAERLAREAGQQIAQRYDHPVFAVEGMDCADCARTFELAITRMAGVHYATVNFTAARLRLEYDREQTSVAAIVDLARGMGYSLRAPQVGSTFVCEVDGMCCAAEAGPIELAVRGLPGVQHVVADPALARLAVTYDAQALAADQIVAQVERLGFRVVASDDEQNQEPRTENRAGMPGSWFSVLGSRIGLTRPKDALTALCGLLIAAAWLGGALGAPAGLVAGLYVLATLAGGMFVARSGWATLLATRTLDINLLMAVAAAGALLIGEYAEGAAVVFLFALGNTLEGYTMDRARRSIRALMQLAPATALVLRPRTENQEPRTEHEHDHVHDHEHDHDHMHDAIGSGFSVLGSFDELRLPIGQVRVGETIVVRPGDRVPLDAVVLSGTSAVDQAPITGESVPVDKSAGAELFAGSINGAGALEARVTRPAEDSTLARIIHLVEEAQSQKSRAQRFIDVFAAYYTPAVIAFAALVAVVPPLLAGGGWLDWLYRALVLLVIACPCALVISTPVSIVSAISAAARAGVLFKGGAALEAAGGLRAIAFDKTGTLTMGKPAVTDLVVLASVVDQTRRQGAEETANDERSSSPCLPVSLSVEQAHLLCEVAAVERRSTHPLARAIVAAAEARGLAIPPAADFQSRGGRGASATVAGRTIAIGNRAMFGDRDLAPELAARLGQLERSGRTAMLVARDGEPIGIIGAADLPRAESQAALGALRRQGIAQITMLTGDAAPVAERIGAELGVDEVRAELLPDQKLAAIGELLGRHGQVAMVGDGVNDAPALARATVGIAMGAAGSDAALETADVTLMSDDLGKLPLAIGLSRAARRVILQNITFALAVKALFLAATLLGAATLWMAVFADTGAALIVIANGMRLLRYRA
jgi:Cd2+/Zn2+-exporting ATPase